MTGHSDSVLVQRLEVVNTGRRRRWSLDEKRRIVAESYQGHRQVSSVARRYEISRSQLYAWRRALAPGWCDGAAVAGFSPAVVVPSGENLARDDAAVGRMEVVTSGGHRILVGADVDAGAFARVVAVLEGGW